MEPSSRPVEIKFRVDPQEKAEAERISRHIGMTMNEVMRVMFRRFVGERGFPFEMRETSSVPTLADSATVFGIPISRLAALARSAGEEATQQHLREGRSISYAREDGTLVREYPDGRIEILADEPSRDRSSPPRRVIFLYSLKRLQELRFFTIEPC